jgi:ubiquinone/menaquinone biosynthesis C-methylase UbiE
MKYEDNPKSIKYHVKKYLLNNKDFLANKKVVDCPAGNGVTSRILKEIGAEPIPFDLFPEYFEIEGLKCERANVMDRLPLENHHADAVICQEGIEHFSDQIKPLQEFNRVLKKEGTLLITTPNYSNLRSRLSYMLAESERFLSMMPPNEMDSIWMSKQDVSKEVYYGHIFLIGFQKLRVLGKLSGFKIRKVHFTRAKSTSILLLPLFYPFIVLFNVLAFRKSLKKTPPELREEKRKIYKEQLSLNLSIKNLIASHIVIEFEKEMDYDKVGESLMSRDQDFSQNAT